VAPGVIGGGFGAVEAIKRLGLERRVFAVGKHKAALDPFKCARAHCSDGAEPSSSERHDVLANALIRTGTKQNVLLHGGEDTQCRPLRLA